MQNENESNKKNPFAFKTKVLAKKNPALSRVKSHTFIGKDSWNYNESSEDLNRSVIFGKSLKEFQTEIKTPRNFQISKQTSIQDHSTNFLFTQSNKDYIDSSQCHICSIDFGTITHKKKHCKLCGKSCCQNCSPLRINRKRVCGICYYIYVNKEEENNKEEFLKQYASNIKSLKYKLQNSETKIDYLKNEIVQLNNRIEEEVTNYEDKITEKENILRTLRMKEENRRNAYEVMKAQEKKLDDLHKQKKLTCQKIQKNLSLEQEEYKTKNEIFTNKLRLFASIKAEIEDFETQKKMCEKGVKDYEVKPKNLNFESNSNTNYQIQSGSSLSNQPSILNSSIAPYEKNKIVFYESALIKEDDDIEVKEEKPVCQKSCLIF